MLPKIVFDHKGKLLRGCSPNETSVLQVFVKCKKLSIAEFGFRSAEWIKADGATR
jgi:hypothetical protein